MVSVRYRTMPTASLRHDSPNTTAYRSSFAPSRCITAMTVTCRRHGGVASIPSFSADRVMNMRRIGLHWATLTVSVVLMMEPYISDSMNVSG